jgi:hypothetical protein
VLFHFQKNIIYKHQISFSLEEISTHKIKIASKSVTIHLPQQQNTLLSPKADAIKLKTNYIVKIEGKC